MRGVQNIIMMRKAGRKPSVVWVEMLPMQKWTRYLTETADRHVDIHMDEKDSMTVDLADLRCLSGIGMVYVNGPDNDLTEKVARACFRAGAKVVEAFWFDVSNPHRIEITKGLRLSEEGEKVVWQK
jgi:hypothetical protein